MVILVNRVTCTKDKTRVNSLHALYILCILHHNWTQTYFSLRLRKKLSVTICLPVYVVLFYAVHMPRALRISWGLQSCHNSFVQHNINNFDNMIRHCSLSLLICLSIWAPVHAGVTSLLTPSAIQPACTMSRAAFVSPTLSARKNSVCPMEVSLLEWTDHLKWRGAWSSGRS